MAGIVAPDAVASDGGAEAGSANWGRDIKTSGSVSRCWWCGDDPLYVRYHDAEWGVPLRDERALFELLCLEGFQAGLSWITILRKRVAFREAFAGFDIREVARFGAREVEDILRNPAVVRHRGKITAAIANAGAVEAMAEQGTSLSEIVWSHAPLPRDEPLPDRHAIPARTPESAALATELRRWGMRFVGPTTVYAFMQSAGLVDDHVGDCHRSGVGNVARRAAHRSPKPLPKPQRKQRTT